MEWRERERENVFIWRISLSHIFSIEFPLVILRLLDSLNGLSRVDSEISAFPGKIWPRGGCRSGRLCGKHAESGRPADWMTDSISETQSTGYPSLSGTQNGTVQPLSRPGGRAAAR